MPDRPAMSAIPDPPCPGDNRGACLQAVRTQRTGPDHPWCSVALRKGRRQWWQCLLSGQRMQNQRMQNQRMQNRLAHGGCISSAEMPCSSQNIPARNMRVCTNRNRFQQYIWGLRHGPGRGLMATLVARAGDRDAINQDRAIAIRELLKHSWPLANVGQIKKSRHTSANQSSQPVKSTSQIKARQRTRDCSMHRTTEGS